MIGSSTEKEPAAVQEARRVIREWELRDGHDAYVDCLDGGWRGYQAACWDCGWRGTEMRRWQNARREARQHRTETLPEHL